MNAASRMANDNRRSRKVMDEKSVKSKKKIVTKDASPAPTLGPSDTSSLSRSSRETSLRKQTQENTSNTRKSERIDKMTTSSTPPPVKKSERIQKQMTMSPIKRSDRGKKHTSGSSGSKKVVGEPVLSNMDSKKEKVKRSLEQCAVDTGKDRHGKQGPDVGGRKRKRAVTHIYKALKPQRIQIEAGVINDKDSRDKLSQANSSSNGDADKELKRPDKLPQLDNSKNKDSGFKSVEDKDDGGDECSDRMGEKSSLRAYKRQRRKSYPGLRKSIESGSEESICGKGSSSERETLTRNTDSDACVNIKDNPISRSSPSSGCKSHGHDETACSKKARTNHSLGKQQELDYCDATCNTNLLDASSSKDRRTCEAACLSEVVEKNDVVSRMGTSICVACKLGGKLRCCDAVGCNRCYHLSCLDPSVNNVPLGNWHCPFCVKNIKSSFPSVSGVVESIWDTREVEVSDAEGLQKQKQYFVKYKGLAHIHNQWVTETQLLREAPQHVANFSKNNSLMKWTVAWTVPHQLLKKRLLLSFKPLNESQKHAGKVLNYHYEWLVKWQGLDYEQSTWESETTSVLDSPKGHNLIKEFENHHGKARISGSPVDKTEELPVKLPTIPDGFPPGMDNIHLSYVKNLHDAWNKGQNSVVFDDQMREGNMMERSHLQERTMRVVLFILSLKGATLPFLLITTSNSLSRWEDMFLRASPCNDFKVSIEDTEDQRSARLLELQKEGGQLAFQVLLYPVDAVVKDLDVLKAIKWEAVIVDESQSVEISTHFSHIKSLSVDKRLLVFCGPLGASMAGYLDVLSLLGYDGDLPGGVISRMECDDISKLKESLSRFIAYECKSSSSKFVEFWVPVQIANVQLEQYCSVLLSNAMALSSCSKSDTVGALHDILVSNRKCCDHPYIVDQSLQGVLTKDLEPAKFLDVGIKASGKLQLLDLMLPEMKKRKLRVLILFQPLSGSGKGSSSLGDILDDFVRQRFGEDSYERVDGIGIIPSKKQAALNNFNNKEMGRFIFLLEYRACLPSIKLSSVDSIVIFDSDWNPTNDFKALQKITIDSQSEKIMIFRLYTSWTLEEKILRLAEQNVTIDSKLQNLSRSTSDALLMWGAPYLFNKLAEFHSNKSSEELLYNKLMEEFLNLISHKCKNKDTNKLIITRVNQSCGTYGKNLPLPSQRITQLPDGDQEPHIFWKKLLDGKNPRWKYLSQSTPRQRKRIQYFEASPEKTNAGNDDVGSKRKKTSNNIIEPSTSKPALEKGPSGVPTNDESQLSPGGSFWCSAIHNETNFRDLLKCNIAKLCKFFELSEDLKIMVERFLEYVIENYRVIKEPANTLQAFLLSLCWMGSELLKQKLDRRQSLNLAKKHLHFSCKEEEANSVYLKLVPAKDMFLRHIENQKKTNVSKDSMPRVSQSGPLNPQGVKVEVLESPDCQYADNEGILLELVRAEIQKLLNEETLMCSKQAASECGRQNEKYVEDEKMLMKLARSEIRKLLKEKTLPCEHLAEKYKNEIEKFHRECDAKRVCLENEYKVAKSFVCNKQNPSARSVKLKSLDNVFANKVEAHERQKSIQLKHLKAMQVAVEGWIAATSNSPVCEGNTHNENPVVSSGASEHGGQDSPKSAPKILTEVQSQDKDDVQIADVTISSVPDEVPSKKQEDIPTDTVNQADSCEIRVLDADGNTEIAEAATIIPDEDRDDSRRKVDCNQENAESGTISPDVSHVLEDYNDSVGSVPTNPEIQNEASQDKEIQVNPSSSTEVNNLRPIEAAQVDQLISEDSSLEPRDEPSVLLLANPAVPEVTHEEQSLPYNSEPSNPSDHTMRQSRLNLEQSDLRSANRVDCQPSIEPHNRSQNLSNVQGSNINQSPSCSDPLQAELEILCELKNTVIKCYEEIKLKLKSDHEKELAEMIAELNRKYEAKNEDAEAAFQSKKKEVDSCLHKVVMNKILAHAFRTNCKDRLLSDAAGIQQVTQTQHPRQFPIQHSTGPAWSSRTQPVITMVQPPLQIVHQPAQLFSATLSRPPPTTTTRIRPPPPITNPTTPTRPPSPMVNPTTTTAPTRPPPPPPMANPTTLTRPPPHINPITPAARNPRPSGEIRAPAPHIRPFRPSSSRVVPTHHVSSGFPATQTSPSGFPAASSLPTQPSPQPPQPPPPLHTNHNTLPTQNSPSSFPAAAPPPSPLPPLQPNRDSLPTQNPPSGFPAASPPPPPASIQLPPIPSVSITHTGLYTSFPRPETRTPDILSLPPLDLLMNSDDWAAGKLPNILPPLPDLTSHISLSGNVDRPNNSLSGDLVCLSDDD